MSLSFRRFAPTDAPPGMWYAGARVAGITVENDGRLVGSGGTWIIGPHAFVWLNVADESFRSAHLLHRWGRSVVGSALKLHGRAWAICDHTKPNAARWLTRLGFRCRHDTELDELLRTIEIGAERGALWTANGEARHVGH